MCYTLGGTPVLHLGGGRNLIEERLYTRPMAICL